MNEQEVRSSILEACKYLQKTGLIVRTWGNVSARLNDHQFIITPSGLAYELTKPEDLVIVNIDDCSYDSSQRKPSSEKRIHASAYKLRNDINFVVHTHQFYGSALAADNKDVIFEDGTKVACAGYGLPGTKKLANNILKAFENNKDEDLFLMARHGVITLGKDKEDALSKAEYLEKESKKLFESKVKEIYIPKNLKAYLDDYAQMFPPVSENKDKEALILVERKNAAAALYAENAKPISFIDKTIQHFVYVKKYSKMRDKK